MLNISVLETNWPNDRRKYDIIPLLIEVAQAAAKEKVIRVIIATFRVSVCDSSSSHTSDLAL